MARLLRIEFAGAIYHVTGRMIGQRSDATGVGQGVWPLEKRLFRDDVDYWGFLDRLAERVEQFRVRLYLFTCMINHFHLVFETPRANCAKFMQSLSTAYTVYHNRRHGRHGHLLDGRYKARLVEGNEYLLALSRYVHLNPVHVSGWRNRPLHERHEHLRNFRWSSYPGYVNSRRQVDFVEYGPILGQMEGPRREWPKRYREYVQTGLAEGDEEFEEVLSCSRHSIGGEKFRAAMDERYSECVATCAHPEDVTFRQTREVLSRDEVMGVLCKVFDAKLEAFKQRRRRSPLRAAAARFLISYGGMTQREAGSFLNVGSGAAICNQLRRLPAKLEKDDNLCRLIARADRRLRRMYDAKRRSARH